MITSVDIRETIVKIEEVVQKHTETINGKTINYDMVLDTQVTVIEGDRVVVLDSTNYENWDANDPDERLLSIAYNILTDGGFFQGE